MTSQPEGDGRQIITYLDAVSATLENQAEIVLGEALRFGQNGYVFIARALHKQVSSLHDVISELQLIRGRVKDEAPGYVLHFDTSTDNPE